MKDKRAYVAIIKYDSRNTLEQDFRDEIKQALTSSTNVKSINIDELKEDIFEAKLLIPGGGLPPPWLEIILTFASATIATSMLTKISEDVYNHFKGKIREFVDIK